MMLSYYLVLQRHLKIKKITSVSKHSLYTLQGINSYMFIFNALVTHRVYGQSRHLDNKLNHFYIIFLDFRELMTEMSNRLLDH